MIRFFKSRDAELGHLETGVLEILWKLGEGNVHQVMPLLTRPLAYTTVMTTLDRLYKKGLLDRRKEDRAFVYTPRYSRVEWERKRAGDFLSGFLGQPQASGELLISCLVDAVGRHDEALLDELERRIRERRKEIGKRRKA
ncbi:MAG TPA: BlaI/MecI/CopY family transcriptional regulator [Candidatus Limnocylindrales bacterium]|nr:BlaI/MecI/CopY family transcriptional regulator [Candidatus Limnocylindrales bacterium]